MGVAWEQHAMCESAFIWSFVCNYSWPTSNLQSLHTVFLLYHNVYPATEIIWVFGADCADLSFYDLTDIIRGLFYGLALALPLCYPA